MNLKDNFNKKDISEAFKIWKDKLSLNTAGYETIFHSFIKREKAIWAELGYEETMARAVEAWDRMNTRRIFAVSGSVFAVAVIAFGVHVAVQPTAYSVEINGVQVGYAESQEVVDEALADLQSDVIESAGVEAVIVDENAITCVATTEKKLSLMDAAEIEEAILDADICKVEGWEIDVNGEPVVTAANQDAAMEILTGVKESYKSDGGEIVGFSYKEDVAVKKCETAIDGLMPVEDAVTYILTGSEEPQTYTVQEGDTVWDIAIKNGMKPAELVAANPEFEADKIKIGQVLNLVAVKPYMTVTLTEKVVATEAIPFDTKYINDASLAKGKTKVQTAGVNGQKEVVSQVVKENGVVVASSVLAETVLSQPVQQVASRGTKATAYYASASVKGSGVLGHPLASINPSKNGGLYGASRGGRRHLGVDLRSSKGTPIYAADGGTVTKVSSNGSYGKLIVINHGNGFVTKYAHCNSIGVSVGQKVSKGQQIGTVGNTGNATGYILHFEVLVNGSNVNPLNYL